MYSRGLVSRPTLGGTLFLKTRDPLFEVEKVCFTQPSRRLYVRIGSRTKTEHSTCGQGVV